MISQSARFLLEREQAQTIIAKMEKAVRANWYKTLRASGVSEQDTEQLKGAFAYPGFSLPLDRARATLVGEMI